MGPSLLRGRGWPRVLERTVYLLKQQSLELEVDEALEVGRDELADYKDGYGASQNHQSQRHFGKPDAITPLEIIGQPMDQHSDDENDYYAPMLPSHLWHQRPVPGTSNLVNHILRRIPSLLIRLGRIQVGAAAEEKTSEGYEYEGHEYRPSAAYPVDELALSALVEHHSDNGTEEDNHSPPEEQVEDRRAEEMPQRTESGDYKPYHNHLEISVATGPEAVNQHSETVKTTPDHEVPARPMPKTSEKHRIHPVNVGDKLFTPVLLECDQQGYHSGQYQYAAEDPPASGQGGCEEGYSENDSIGTESAVAVASKRYIQIILKPFGERYMPSFPELSGVLGLIGGIEILGEIESHQHGDSGGDVGVAGEVGIDL